MSRRPIDLRLKSEAKHRVRIELTWAAAHDVLLLVPVVEIDLRPVKSLHSEN